MRFIIFVLLVFGYSSLEAKMTDSCECPEVKCSNPCESNEGVTFYTEKCDSGKRVKSCAKPTCVPKEDPDALCLAWQKKKGIKRNIASDQPKVNQESKVAYIAPPPKVARINMIQGKAWIKSENGARRVAKIKMHVRESDTVITNGDGRVRLTMENGNILHVMPNSQTKITEYDNEKNSKKTLIDLINGKVRSKVKTKYKGATNYYRVRTKSAVAGVRGTDFVVTYEVNQKAVTKVETITGEVQLNSADDKQKQKILAGTAGSFIVAANTGEVFNEEEISDFISRGYMTPVYKMTGAEVKKLKWETDVHRDRYVEKSIARGKNSKNICAAPAGQLNQCAWECVNNPKGEKRCRTDLPQVNCVRKRCNANGEWADEDRLPASYYDKCKSRGAKVTNCDY